MRCVPLKSKGYIYTILLTARDAIEHVVTGLQAGADDYLTKPVIEPELMARLSTGRRIVTLERSLRAANDENRRLSVTDALTGVHNRRYLMEQIPREIERAARYGRELAAVMCDVDHFKKINDAHGHLVGDAVLKWFVTKLRTGVRSSDWVARYGGEEFLIVLPETNVSKAAIKAEQLRAEISRAPFESAGASFPVDRQFRRRGLERRGPARARLSMHSSRHATPACMRARRPGATRCLSRRWAESGLLATGLWPESADGPSGIGLWSESAALRTIRLQ